MGQVIAALDEESARPFVDFLSHTSSWRTQLQQADWRVMDYEAGLTACREEQRVLRNDLMALGLLNFEED